MKTNQTLKIRDKKFSLKTLVSVVLIAVLLTGLTGYLVFSNPTGGYTSTNIPQNKMAFFMEAFKSAVNTGLETFLKVRNFEEIV